MNLCHYFYTLLKMTTSLFYFEDSEICVVQGTLATDFLESIQMDERWPHRNMHISMGWHTFMGSQVHYLNANYLDDIIMGFIKLLGLNLQIIQGDSQILPMRHFEEYHPPSNLDEAIMSGYLSDEEEDRDDRQPHSGGYRKNYPVI
jgi:hypothetical protein